MCISSQTESIYLLLISLFFLYLSRFLKLEVFITMIDVIFSFNDCWNSNERNCTADYRDFLLTDQLDITGRQWGKFWLGVTAVCLFILETRRTLLDYYWYVYLPKFKYQPLAYQIREKGSAWARRFWKFVIYNSDTFIQCGFASHCPERKFCSVKVYDVIQYFRLVFLLKLHFFSPLLSRDTSILRQIINFTLSSIQREEGREFVHACVDRKLCMWVSCLN